MKSKIVFFSLLAFCLTMTTWLIRSVYFPDQNRSSEVEFSTILGRFLREQADVTTLHVYHGEKRLGFASVNTRPVNANQKDNHFILISGFLQQGVIPNVEDQIAWRIDFRVDNYEEWNGGKGQVRLPKMGHTLDFKWAKDDKIPQFTLRQGGKVIADDKMVAPMMSLGLGNKALDQAGIHPDSFTMEQSARTGALEIAGQKRSGYFLDIVVAKRWKIRAFFTEVGQLAVVDFPNGYRLVEPIMYGLVPDYTEEEEEAISQEKFDQLREQSK